MSYRVQVARPASRQLAVELPEAVATACVEFIFGALAENPHRLGSRLGPPPGASRQAPISVDTYLRTYVFGGIRGSSRERLR